MSDALAELETLLVELPDAVGRRQLGDRLNQSMETLKSADYQVERLKVVLELADLTEMTSGPQAQAIRELQEEAFDVGTQLEEAASDDELRDAVHSYHNELLRSLASSELVMRNQWKVLAAQRFRSLGALGQLLQRIGVDPDLGARLAAVGQRATRAGDLTPATAMCADVKTLLAERDELQAERADRLSEGEIGSFISALAEHRATLDMVTPEVRTWLNDNDALHRFTIEPRLQGNAGGGAG
jgi:hypothetical protein